MNAIEFITELGPEPILAIPEEAAAQLPKSGTARIIVLTRDGAEEADRDPEQVLREEWSAAAEQGLARAYGHEEPEYGPGDIK